MRILSSAGRFYYTAAVYEPVMFGELFRMEGLGGDWHSFLNDTCVRIGIE